MNIRSANDGRLAWPRAMNEDEEEPPADLLQRHSARVLDASGQDDSVSATVYRSDVLLGPPNLLASRPDLLGHGRGDTDGAFNRLLAEAGWFLEPEIVDEQAWHAVTTLRVRQRSILNPDHRPQRLLENRIDAFRALQVLRLGSRGSEIAKVVSMLSVDHLLFATTIGGMPITEGHPGPEQPGEAVRGPVAVLAAPPRRRPVSSVPGGRRPVVAVLDTGVGAHDWLDTVPTVTVADPFVLNASRRGFVPRSSETSGVSAPLVGMLDTHAGHGTFITGIIRQTAPDASVLMLSIMHGDGVVYESTLIDALTWIRREVQSGDPARFIDIVCMPFGYHEETPRDVLYTSQLRARLEDLCALGVQIVTSAGNRATQRRTFPAALARTASTPGSIVSVGALNPNRTRAIYSNQASWITDWEVGTRIVSTMPPFDASRSPTLQTTAGGGPVRESVDSDDFSGGTRGSRVFTGGFAQWSGTSFAAGAYAGRLAQAMLDEADMPGAAMPTLSPVDAASARARAGRALTVCRA